MFIKFDGKPAEYHSFISALIGGYLIWGKYNKVNEQVSEFNSFLWWNDTIQSSVCVNGYGIGFMYNFFITNS